MKKQAVFTIARYNEASLLVWIGSYMRHFDKADCYVLDHNSSHAYLRGLPCQVVPVSNDAADSLWTCAVVNQFQRFLLESYENVVFTCADELLVADPMVYPNGLRSYLAINDLPRVRSLGCNVVHESDEPELDWDKPILAQRRSLWVSDRYSKTAVTKVHTTWKPGFATIEEEGLLDRNLYLIHLRRADYYSCLEKNRTLAARMAETGDGIRERDRLVTDPEEFAKWFVTQDVGDYRMEIPDHLKEAV